MQKYVLKKKVFATISFFILVIIGFFPVAQSLIIKEKNTFLKTILNTQNNGTLSGFVKDPINDPIEGALVRVYFHEEFRENYSDFNGYYHVTDIPLCYCLKNATCSKEGYKTEWVLLSIGENTTYDFTLYPLGSCYPVFNGTMGCNGWYINPVEVSFVYDPEEVVDIWYNYKGWNIYTGLFMIFEEGAITVEFYWIDHKGMQSPIQSFILKIDYTPPITNLQWEVCKQGLTWYVIRCKLTAVDSISGMNPHLWIYLNDLLQREFDVFTWPIFEFEIHWSKIFKNFTFKFICFDNAGNMAYQSINGSDIKPININQQVHAQKFFNSYFYSFFWYFKKFFLIFKI